MKKQIPAVAAALLVAGCTIPPAEYASTLPPQDPKWQTPECEKARLAAMNHQEAPAYWTAGLLLGPYGLGMVAAAKEHQEKQRRQLVRELHLKCSSSPLPSSLRIKSNTAQH